MKQLGKILVRSILAGIFISIGALVYVNNTNAYGALFFSVGLLAVFWLGLDLYTGKLAFVQFKRDQLCYITAVLVANIIGCMLLFLINSTAVQTTAVEIVTKKLQLPWYTNALKSIICGALIYLAVHEHQKKNDYATLIIVPAFILSGAEHSIADVAYVILSKTFSINILLFLLLVIVGNFIGGKGLYILDTYINRSQVTK